jgi:hypothetical protein
MKTSVINLACKVLGASHLVGQTLADLSLNAEIKLRQTDDLSAKQIIDARITRTMSLQAKAGIYSPFNAIVDMTQDQQ